MMLSVHNARNVMRTRIQTPTLECSQFKHQHLKQILFFKSVMSTTADVKIFKHFKGQGVEIKRVLRSPAVVVSQDVGVANDNQQRLGSRQSHVEPLNKKKKNCKNIQ
jgi:hypothetical protein